MRINKYISDSGFCSRREADRFVESGKVTINGRKAEMGAKVTEADTVKVNGRLVKHNAVKRVYIALNKPIGIVSTTDPKERDNIADFVGYHTRIFNIGRLDKPSEGLILLTNDGDIVNKVLRAANNHEKEYDVEVNKPITEDFLRRMASGVPILGTRTKKCRIEQRGERKFRIVLTQGLNRQIRRMCEYLGFDVVRLKRIRIMNIHLGRLPVGQWRFLTSEEITTLNKSIEHSDGTQEASRIDGGFVKKPQQSAKKPQQSVKKPHSIAKNGKTINRRKK